MRLGWPKNVLPNVVILFLARYTLHYQPLQSGHEAKDACNQ